MAQRRGSGEPDPVQARALGRLNQLIAELDISQKTLAERSGFTQGHVSKVLRGESPEVAFWVIARLAKALDVSLDWLIEEPPAPSQARSSR